MTKRKQPQQLPPSLLFPLLIEQNRRKYIQNDYECVFVIYKLQHPHIPMYTQIMHMGVDYPSEAKMNGNLLLISI